MKKIITYLVFGIIVHLVGNQSVFGANVTQLSTSGNWAGGTLTTDVSVVLAGNVYLKAPIVIPDGYTLTINKKTVANGGEKYYSILLHDDFAVPSGAFHCMFEVQEGGTLKILGNGSEDFIAIKGNTGWEVPTACQSPSPDNADFKAMVSDMYSNSPKTYIREGYKVYTSTSKNNFLYDFGKSSASSKRGAVLSVVGTLEMKYAKIGCSFSSDEGAAIRRPRIADLPSTTVYGTMKLTNVEIRNCFAKSGPAMIIYNQVESGRGEGNTAESCKVTITNSKFYRNYSNTTGVCGTIRTGGGAVGTVEMINTNVYGNYSEGYAAGLCMSAQGSEDTRTILNGCEIHDNYAGSYAGGAMFAGSFEFTGDKKTKIYNNTAVTYGGGLYVTSYNGVKFNETKVLSMQFNDKLEVYDNNASNGAGICLFMRKTTSLQAGSTINLDMDGVVITGNTATQSGGGLLLAYNNTDLLINLNINSGTISNNTAATYGGGIYCLVGVIGSEDPAEGLDSSKCKVYLNGGTISGNKATNGSGGGVAVFQLPIYCEENAEGIKVFDNESMNKGGGLFIDEGSVFTMNSGNVYKNNCTYATSEGGGIFCRGSVMNISGGVIGGEGGANTAYNGAGIFLHRSTLVMNNGLVSSNVAGQNAGGIYLKSSSMSLNNGTIDSNTSGTNGGGIYVTKMPEDADIVTNIEITDGVISGNTTVTYGGGIYVGACNKFSINGGEISGNKSTNSNGGGIFLNSSEKNVTILGGVIKNNTALSGLGGGIVVACDATISGGEISGNRAKDGGGISQSGHVLAIEGGYVMNNTASEYGAGVYLYNSGTCNFSGGEISGNKPSDGATSVLGGGVYVLSGSFIVDGGNITSNNATEGGGLYANDGTITISDGDIDSNRASLGGGIRLNGSANLTFTGGNVSNNTADENGGGFYTGGNSICTFSEGNVTDNTAANGGGIYMMDYSKMTFSNGIIRDNYAKATGTGYGTAYGNETVRGAGGGLFLKDNAQFEFVPNSSVGIFNNIANMAGDDLVVGSANAQVVLPDVSNMVLTGYNSKTSELFWVEDYMTDDTAYDSGTKIAGAGHKAVRYRDAIASQSTVYKVPAGTYTGKYLALSIGHEVIYVILKKSGLQPGESAVFRISRVDNAETTTTYSELLMTGVAGGAEQTRTVALYSGTWKVEELPWTWSYAPIPAIQREITGSSTAEDKTFTFVNNKQSDLPLHAEDIVVNDFGAGAAVTGSYVNSGSINDLQNTTDYQLK